MDLSIDRSQESEAEFSFEVRSQDSGAMCQGADSCDAAGVFCGKDY